MYDLDNASYDEGIVTRISTDFTPNFTPKNNIFRNVKYIRGNSKVADA